MIIEIDSRIKLLSKLSSEYTSNDVRDEPMFFNASAEFAWDKGGEITKDFLFTLYRHYGHSDWVIDTKSCMLMPGWYPCIPGFHHDDVPREREDGQPDYVNPSYRSKHVLALAGDDICRTEFALGRAEFVEPPLGEIIYKEWHPVVEKLTEYGVLSKVNVPMHQLVEFDDRSWHQGIPSAGSGWRWFGRASTNTARLNGVTNDIRNQVQVYLENPMEGW